MRRSGNILNLLAEGVLIVPKFQEIATLSCLKGVIPMLLLLPCSDVLILDRSTNNGGGMGKILTPEITNLCRALAMDVRFRSRSVGREIGIWLVRHIAECTSEEKTHFTESEQHVLVSTIRGFERVYFIGSLWVLRDNADLLIPIDGWKYFFSRFEVERISIVALKRRGILDTRENLEEYIHLNWLSAQEALETLTAEALA